MAMRRLSQYFYWENVTHSETAERLGIDNTLPVALESNARYTADKMDAIRLALGTPIYVSSWYRCMELNCTLGSKDTSKHIVCLAVDWSSPGFGTPVQTAKYLVANKVGLNWDQLILEHTWIHTAFINNYKPPRLEVLSLLDTGNYAVGLTDKFGKSLT